MFKFRRYNKNDEAVWDKFVSDSNNGTIFHLRKFLNYHSKDKFVDHSILIIKNKKLFSVFPAAERVVSNQKLLVSHPGSSVGSFVIPENLSIANSIELVSQIKNYAKESGFNGIQITLPPNLYQKRLSNYMDFAFFRGGFIYKKREITSILFLEKNIETTLKKFRPSHRRAVKIAQSKGVIVRESEKYDEYYKILQKNLSKRHGVNPTHTLRELKKLKRIFKDKIKLFSAFIDGKMIAGIVNFIINEQVVLAFYISHDELYNQYRPLNILFYEVFSWAIESKYKVYDFGIFTVNEKPNMGLGRFKENFGASGIFRDTIELKLNK
ncbi:MAG: GNAT family N-acetyltransferase [Candidatus Neomarinimicrobiota bacterium]|tara:strand:- start:1405 stop:2376 length:972 start_codon:yes stop_codon:yes gene_type:complete